VSTTTTIDGQPVAQATARAFEKLAADFLKRTGKSLHVTDGYRSRAQQQALYDDYLAGRGNLAAAPGHSEHETGRALDVHDSGTDAGVTTIGTARHKVLASIAGTHGFRMTGETFSPPEGWHIEYWGGDPWAGISFPATSTSTLKRGSTGTHVKALQRGLNRVFPAYSKLAVDADFGPKTESVVREFQKRAHIAVDGIVGPITKAKLASYGVTF
jgi:hypothetical protein